MNPIFPAGDFTLLAIIIALPLVGAFVNGVFGKRLGKEAVTLMALSSVGASFLASVYTFFALRAAQTAEQAARFHWHGWEWMRLSSRTDAMGAGSNVPIELAFSVDALSGTMILVITGVGLLIHLYSTQYMRQDEGYHRFFAYLNLFVFSMLVLVLGDSLPVLFVGWEGVGVCSYLLIGFWFHEDANAAAGKKAFIANRIGDFGLLVAMGLLVYYCGALDWKGIEAASSSLAQPVKYWPIGTHVPLAAALPESAANWLNAPRYASAATLVSLALFLGAAGKSAQLPLYVWLPDAMAGPTPVSALIHAATMVTAGIYLCARLAGVFVLSPAAMFTVALIGAATALFAATIALVQNDIKKVLAYSTVSQLGYMFLGVGVGAFSAGFFHVLTHAFFKACLFLGAGSVIYAMHARIHDTERSQDMRHMGGMRAFMPITFATFVAAWGAIVGFPLLSGFFSKDEILFKAYTSSVVAPGDGKLHTARGVIDAFVWPSWGPTVLYGMGVVAAALTAFYMTRLVIGIFFGSFKGWTVVPHWKEPEGDPHAHEHAHHAVEEALEGPAPKESPWQMTLPLVVLGLLSVFAGALNAHALFHSHVLDTWLEPVFAHAQSGIKLVENEEALAIPLLIPSVVVFLLGAGVAYWMYLMAGGEPARKLASAAPRLYQLLYDKWRVDELYEETIIGAVDSLADFAAAFDRIVVDGVLARLTALLVRASGGLLRLLQTGRVHVYALSMVVGLGGLGWFFVAPHATASLERNDGAGAYVLTAAPGLGYQYRWYAEGEQPQDFGQQHTYELTIDKAGDTRKVKLEVKNAFGRVDAKEYVVNRAKPDLSGLPLTIDVGQGADGQLRGDVRPQPGAPQ